MVLVRLRVTGLDREACQGRLEQGASQPTVNRDDGAGHVTAAVGREETDHVGDLLRAAEPPQRNLLHVGRARALGKTSISRAVSIRPGAIELTVIFCGPSSRAIVFAQPITPGRIELESARLSAGPRPPLEAMLMIRPGPLRSSLGRPTPVTRTIVSSSSSTARSTASSVSSTVG